MNTFERRTLNLALRNDLATFIFRSFQTIVPGQRFLLNWHILALAWHLEQCANGSIKRLLITLPPRHLKSICASVAFAGIFSPRYAARQLALGLPRRRFVLE